MLFNAFFVKVVGVFVDLRWVNVQNADEASKIQRVGNKNRSAAATKMNQSSSRRSFIIRLPIKKKSGFVYSKYKGA